MDPSPDAPSLNPTETEPTLRRAVGLPLLVLYGLGITIGAGIYVLIGAAAAKAGPYAPSAFLLAAFVMAFSALSFAELSGRIPQSAGEAVYVDAGFGRNWLTLATGLMIIFSATIAGAAIAIGCAGYVAVLLPTQVPQTTIVCVIVVSMGAVAGRGVKESVLFAGLLTVIEILGLLAIVVAGFVADPGLYTRLPSAFPPLSDAAALSGVLGASLVAFFAFIGFDDVVNLVEETHDPKRVMPRAIIASLLAVTVIYFLVVFVAVQSLPVDTLAGSSAPIGLLFKELTGLHPLGITLVAVVATINGVVIEIIMAARVVYGLGRKGRLPKVLAKVHPVSRVPRNATVLITAAMLVAAIFVPLDALVAWTSQIILAVFTLVNISLALIKWRGDASPADIFTVPLVVPVLGAVTCVFLLVGPLIWV